MRTFRLLLWLRWKLFLRSTTVGNRIAAAAFTLLLLLAFSPAWFGGAVATFAAVRTGGAAVLPVVFGVTQLAWLSLGIVSGALGRSFDLDKFLRYPVRPHAVFGINVLASLIGPVPLMTMPALAAAAIAAGLRAGPLAALGTALAGACVLLVTGALLQVLLALFDELLRKEATRFVATIVMTFVFVGLQFGARALARAFAEQAVVKLANHEISLRQAVDLMAVVLARVPTVGAPVMLASGAIEGAPVRALLGLLASLALLALGVLPGAALMRRTVRRSEADSGGARRSAAPGGSGSFALPGVPRGVGLVLRYELLMTLRHPQRLVSILITPLVGVVFFANGHGRVLAGALFVFLMLATSVVSASMMLFGYDGPGVRSFFLLPLPPRELLLAKSLEVLTRLVLQIVLAFGAIAFISSAIWTPLLFTALVADLALIFGAMAAGTTVSLKHPVRARRRGLTGRGNTNWESQLVALGVFAGGAALGAIVWAVRKLSGPAWADPAGMAFAIVALAAAAAIWWRSLELNARVFLESRDRMIDALAKAEED